MMMYGTVSSEQAANRRPNAALSQASIQRKVRCPMDAALFFHSMHRIDKDGALHSQTQYCWLAHTEIIHEQALREHSSRTAVPIWYSYSCCMPAVQTVSCCTLIFVAVTVSWLDSSWVGRHWLTETSRALQPQSLHPADGKTTGVQAEGTT